MTKRWTVLATALVMCLAIPVFAQSDEPEMDPLLELLVEQGVITARAGRVRCRPSTPARRPRWRHVGGDRVTADGASGSADEIRGGRGCSRPPEAAPKKEKWYDKIDFKGDLRLRYEGFWVEGLSDNNHRSRFRLRVRPGIYTDVTDWMDVGSPAAQRRSDSTRCRTTSRWTAVSP